MIRLLRTKNYNLLFQRARTKIAEVDLIFENGAKVLLIEVKTLSSTFASFERIGKKQIHSLRANRVYFSQAFPQKTFLSYVAFVEADRRISFCLID